MYVRVVPGRQTCHEHSALIRDFSFVTCAFTVHMSAVYFSARGKLVLFAIIFLFVRTSSSASQSADSWLTLCRQGLSVGGRALF